jgi:small conductance mechanosensitive channel
MYLLITKNMNLDNINMEQVSSMLGGVMKYSADVVPNIIGAILTLWIGFKVVNMINRMVQTIMKKNDWDPMLESFISSLIAIILKILVIVSAAGIIGVETSSFVALLAAA